MIGEINDFGKNVDTFIFIDIFGVETFGFLDNFRFFDGGVDVGELGSVFVFSVF